MPSLRFYIYLIFGFVLCAIIGTVSHEYGHIAVAQSLGYDTDLHYSSMNWNSDHLRDSIAYYLSGIKSESTQVDSTSLNKRVECLRAIYKEDSFWITLGGPTQTLLVSLLGMLYLFRYNNLEKYKLKSWVALFAVFFSSRFVFNFISSLLDWVVQGELDFGGDESRLSWHLGWDVWVVPAVMFFVGSIICCFGVFYFTPKKCRLAFIISGFIGSAIGYVLWMKILGPIVLP